VREMARRFDLERVTHSAAVFDTDKLSWINRHYMKEAPSERVARMALPYFVRAGWLTDSAPAAAFVELLLPMVVGSVDRLEDIPERLTGLFAWDSERAVATVTGDPDSAAAQSVIHAFAQEIATVALLDRQEFRSAAERVRQKTGIKGRALFHPIRDALTAASSGPELDLMVPAIDRATTLPADALVVPVASCRERARAVSERLRSQERA